MADRTIDVGYVHTLTKPGGPCRDDCPHPDHQPPEPPMSEHARLREALAKAASPTRIMMADDGYPSLVVRDAGDLADAILATLPEHRDDVLALLGMGLAGYLDDEGQFWEGAANTHGLTPLYAALSPTEAEEE